MGQTPPPDGEPGEPVHFCRRVVIGAWMLAVSACGGDKETDELSPAEVTAHCQNECRELASFVFEEGFEVDPEAYDEGCANLAPTTCGDCQEDFAVLLAPYFIINECYCIVPSRQRDQDLMSDEECAWFVDEFFDRDASALEDHCSCEN